MGHLLKREERTDADPRVDHFIPDTWQVCIYLITDEFVYRVKGQSTTGN